ncbi:hypothetical protein SAMN05421690_10139 [Nitrosomonas sp. Nm51]|uniref:hypothetical protein n=1 Tax=Nitrosomonas sp. Nm51 TaxID=133720 RepID=UPI0008CA077A|nr:hypothetical protein [Nitrosomonas sp. Nm51]SER21594.1 hypothetical protein SAMN05421690_10139 [Nitrosomonas sp. Nm51]
MNTRDLYIAGVISYLYLGMFFAATAFAAPTPVATYTFDNSFNAQEKDVVAITPIDPLSENSFLTDMIFDEQAGLLLHSRNVLGNRAPTQWSWCFSLKRA